MKFPFLHERKPSLSTAQWYIYFSSVQIQTWVMAQSLGIYRTLSTIRFFMQALWRRVDIE